MRVRLAMPSLGVDPGHGVYLAELSERVHLDARTPFANPFVGLIQVVGGCACGMGSGWIGGVHVDFDRTRFDKEGCVAIVESRKQVDFGLMAVFELMSDDEAVAVDCG